MLFSLCAFQGWGKAGSQGTDEVMPGEGKSACDAAALEFSRCWFHIVSLSHEPWKCLAKSSVWACKVYFSGWFLNLEVIFFFFLFRPCVPISFDYDNMITMRSEAKGKNDFQGIMLRVITRCQTLYQVFYRYWLILTRILLERYYFLPRLRKV